MVGGHETGNETWIRGLVKGFQELDGDFELVAYHVGSPWAPGSEQISFAKLRTANPAFRLGVELPWRSKRDRLDVLHTTYVVPGWSAVPVVVSVHDISYVAHPEWFSPRDLRVLTRAVPWSIARAAHVHTVSEYSRREIIEAYGVPPEKITAIASGPGPAGEPISFEDARVELAAIGVVAARPYLLAVGNLQPRKNLIRLIEAYNRLLSARRIDVDLLIVGPSHFRAHEIVQAADAAAGRIRFTGYVGDRQLAACYRCAAAFIFPSLYEGFGSPPLEAMAHGLPVASSSAGSLPEVCGAAALFFDPFQVDSIANALEKILGDSALRERLTEAGRARVAGYSWKSNAARILDLYREFVD